MILLLSVYPMTTSTKQQERFRVCDNGIHTIYMPLLYCYCGTVNTSQSKCSVRACVWTYVQSMCVDVCTEHIYLPGIIMLVSTTTTTTQCPAVPGIKY